MRALFCLALMMPACLRPAEERALLDRAVGQAAIPGATFVVAGGLAAVRRLASGELELWAHSFHFAFKGTRFSMVDAARATIDPAVHRWVRAWLEAGQGQTHVFVCHIPPLDPVGARGLAFRSRAEAAKLLAALARGRVDLTLYGHLHEYRAFTNAGIEAHISGGGAASVDPDVGHHYLTVDVTPGLWGPAGIGGTVAR